MNVKKKVLSTVLAASLAASLLSVPALAVDDPDEPMSVDTSVATTLSQRAGSEIPQVFGLGVVAGTVFDGYLNLAGTEATDIPDGYAWNYNYGGELDPDEDEYAYYTLSDKLTNANGLYNSGGANQVYAGTVTANADGSKTVTLGKAVGLGTNVIVGFNSNTLDEIVEKRKTDASYTPVIIDVQTGSVSSRLYSWAEMGAAIKDYVGADEDLTTRYGDAYVNGLNVEQFSAGIPYYIASLIADGTIDKKTAAYVNDYDDTASEPTFVCVNPGTLGNVSADVFAEVNNFTFLDGSYTLDELMDEGVDVIILGATGYSYTGTGTGTGQPGGGNASTSADKTEILNDLADDYASSEIPLVMSSDNYGITIGNNGYNYSPITCMFMPYIHAYAYMDELATANSAINPMAMVRFMMEECFHVSSTMSQAVALEYIGTKWNSVADNDQVPSTTNYVYNTTKIKEAIVDGMEYALDGCSTGAEANGNTLLAAYRSNDTAYILLTQYLSDTAPTSGRYITVKVNGVNKYLDLDAQIPTGSDDTSGQFITVATKFQAIVDYYYTRTYGAYGWNLQETLQYYANHMTSHVWKPVIGVPGTYGANISTSQDCASQDCECESCRDRGCCSDQGCDC